MPLRSAQLKDAVTDSLADCKQKLQQAKDNVLDVIEKDQAGRRQMCNVFFLRGRRDASSESPS